MQLILLLLALSYSEGRLYTFQPLTFYHFPTIPNPTPQTDPSPQHVPISPRFLLYPNKQQLGVNSPFPQHKAYTYFLSPGGNVVTAGDDLRQAVTAGNVDEASPLTKTSSVPEERPNEEEIIQAEALSSNSGFGAPQQTTGANPSSSSSAATNLLSSDMVSPQHATRIRTEDGLGGYHFRYSEGSSSRDETRDHRGTVRGSYGVADPSGKIRTYHYVADEGGFRISGPGLPAQNLLEIPAPNEIMNEPAKKSLPEPIWPDTIQEEVHEFPVVSEPGRSKSEVQQSKLSSVNDLNAFGDAKNKVQLAHPYMSQAAYEAVYGTPAVSISGNVPGSNDLKSDQSFGIGSTTRDPVEFGVLEATTTEGSVTETATTEPITGTEPSTMDSSTTPLEYYQ